MTGLASLAGVALRGVVAVLRLALRGVVAVLRLALRGVAVLRHVRPVAGLASLAGVALCSVVAVLCYVRPEAQHTAADLIGIAVCLGIALKIRTGSVW